MGSRRDPMGAGVSVTAVLRAGTSALAAALHTDGTLLYIIIIIYFWLWGNGRALRVGDKTAQPCPLCSASWCGGPPDPILLAPRGRRSKDTLGTSFSSVMNDRGSGESRWTRRGPRNASVAAMATA
ncbi:hypothetical protein TcCL_Unassigned04482 [Trypanosoma cruzi]|nr:hypothetical protein TcCL_Unassigned04482 [Trypanosoma cruzi]